MNSPNFDVTAAQRWFAIACNNGAWDLVEAPTRSPDETARMLDLAHAASWHWSQVGAPVNQQRAACLLATAYVVARDSVAAERYADRCLALTESLTDGLSPFDRAAALGCTAAAAALSKHAGQVELKCAAFTAACDALANADERKLLVKLYGQP